MGGVTKKNAPHNCARKLQYKEVKYSVEDLNLATFSKWRNVIRNVFSADYMEQMQCQVPAYYDLLFHQCALCHFN